jgi:hypothetical protein
VTLFLVGTAKFVILSICSFGIYPIIWTYQNWKHIRDGAVGADGAPHAYKSISPFWRTCMAPFYAITMLQIIKRQADREGITVRWSPVILGFLFLVVSLFAFLPEPWWLLSIGACLPLVPVLATARDINDASDTPGDANNTFSGGNYAVVIIGGLILVVILLAPRA